MLKIGKCVDWLSKRFTQTKDFDQKFADEIEMTDIETIDIKHMLDDVKVKLVTKDETNNNKETNSERIVAATANIIKAGVSSQYTTYLNAYNAAKAIVTDSAISSEADIQTAYDNLVSAKNTLYNAYYRG